MPSKGEVRLTTQGPLYVLLSKLWSQQKKQPIVSWDTGALQESEEVPVRKTYTQSYIVRTSCVSGGVLTPREKIFRAKTVKAGPQGSKASLMPPQATTPADAFEQERRAVVQPREPGEARQGTGRRKGREKRLIQYKHHHFIQGRQWKTRVALVTAI